MVTIQTDSHNSAQKPGDVRFVCFAGIPRMVNPIRYCRFLLLPDLLSSNPSGRGFRLRREAAVSLFGRNEYCLSGCFDMARAEHQPLPTQSPMLLSSIWRWSVAILFDKQRISSYGWRCQLPFAGAVAVTDSRPSRLSIGTHDRGYSDGCGCG